MGNQLLDQYSLLHFSSGVVAYNVGVGVVPWFIAHLSFELLENTPAGMEFINRQLTFWPGGKPRADTALNIVGDNVAAVVGWWSAKWLDDYGKRWGWYKPN